MFENKKRIQINFNQKKNITKIYFFAQSNNSISKGD